MAPKLERIVQLTKIRGSNAAPSKCCVLRKDTLPTLLHVNESVCQLLV